MPINIFMDIYSNCAIVEVVFSCVGALLCWYVAV